MKKKASTSTRARRRCADQPRNTTTTNSEDPRHSIHNHDGPENTRSQDPRAHPRVERAQRQTLGLLTIKETRRQRKEELWMTRQGHTFAATGTSKACHGNAILSHKRLTSGPRFAGVSRKKSSVYKSLQSASHTRDTSQKYTETCKYERAHADWRRPQCTTWSK